MNISIVIMLFELRPFAGDWRHPVISFLRFHVQEGAKTRALVNFYVHNNRRMLELFGIRFGLWKLNVRSLWDD